jgi:hypothetical protein
VGKQQLSRRRYNKWWRATMTFLQFSIHPQLSLALTVAAAAGGGELYCFEALLLLYTKLSPM